MVGDDKPRQPARREVVGRRLVPGADLSPGGDFTYSVVEAAQSRPSGDRRGDRRTRTHLREGVIREIRGRPIADCRIHDLTSRGARLQLDRERPLPKNFVLQDAGTPRSFLATLVWQVGRDAGVKLKAIEDSRT